MVVAVFVSLVDVKAQLLVFVVVVTIVTSETHKVNAPTADAISVG
jgi:biopolymer transport protein ExbD